MGTELSGAIEGRFDRVDQPAGRDERGSERQIEVCLNIRPRVPGRQLIDQRKPLLEMNGGLLMRRAFARAASGAQPTARGGLGHFRV